MLDWPEEDQIRIRCRTGLPVSNVQLEIVDQDGSPVVHDGKSVGEVVVRAPWLTQGYLKDQEKGEELWAGGWLHTGDIGFIDEDGYLQITDRLKDVIKTGGEWVSSLELESIISQHLGVSEVAVVGVPDEKWGERPLAIVVLKEAFKGEVTEQDLKDFCMGFVEKGVIPKFGVPSQIILDQQIPKTSVGKISKKDIRGQFKQ
jgi:fatty-acyl-CoA synthase